MDDYRMPKWANSFIEQMNELLTERNKIIKDIQENNEEMKSIIDDICDIHKETNRLIKENMEPVTQIVNKI